MSEIVALLAERFPGWRVGWWECTEGPRYGVEVSRRIAYARYERHFWAGPTWQAVREQLGSAATAPKGAP